MNRIISVSAAPYDGYGFPEVLESLASCGVSHVEPAFIVGYTAPFDESAFIPGAALQYSQWFQASGLACHAFSSHIELGRADTIEVFRRRMDFAARLGARIINTNAASRSDAAQFFRNIGSLLIHAEQLDMTICLENPGNGGDNLINTAQDGIDVLRQIGHERLRLNYDAGNVISHRPAHQAGGVDPAEDALLAMPDCGHVHIKDVRVTDDGYFFTPLGQGQIDCGRILEALRTTQLNLSIELPLRLHRSPDAQPRRSRDPIPLATIENSIRVSLAFVSAHLAPS